MPRKILNTPPPPAADLRLYQFLFLGLIISRETPVQENSVLGASIPGNRDSLCLRFLGIDQLFILWSTIRIKDLPAREGFPIEIDRELVG